MLSVRSLIAADAAPAKPNIVLIVTDDQGWWDVSSHGNTTISTPNMDRIAREGVEFSRFYVAPVCSLTRAALMTGRYPLRTGVIDTRNGGDTLSTSEVTLAQSLRDNGYATGIFGKWHLGRYMENHPLARGFEQFVGFWKYGHVERYDYPDRLWHNREEVESRIRITTVLTDAAIDFIETQKQPFFCYVPYNVPHAPFHATDELLTKYLKKGVPLRDASIYALVEECDTQIGRILKAIDDRKLRDNTIVIFMSDNGGISKHFTAEIRGNKGGVLEGGVLSPFFVRYPGHFPAGAKVPAMASVIDLFPTLADATGSKLPTDRPIDGKSLLPLLKAGKGDSPHKYLYHTWNRSAANPNRNWAICTPQYKLTDGRLYDLLSDPGEKSDLAKQHPEMVQQLRAEFIRWMNEVSEGQSFQRPAIPVGSKEENPVEIQASWAVTHGKDTKYTFYAYDWDAIEGWNQPGDAITFKLKVAKPGKYVVRISYGASRGAEGAKYKVSAGDSSITAKVEATPSKDLLIQRDIGTLTLPAGETVLRIEATDLPGKEFMSFNRLWLERVE
ncbi:MAG: sulfatase-like hydrolase/transferase [Planctomycetota bacterium]|nr:sulfatase-like hydrolase/transferase [Planctomycetota bacterium]